MLDKEKGNHGLQGGILADEMGLGKTVQTIAIMVHNVSDHPAVKTNLIVGPLALLDQVRLYSFIRAYDQILVLRFDQWQLEIETKTNIGFSCHIYHGQCF
jgi:SNF2 family DNA or RNA helicase